MSKKARITGKKPENPFGDALVDSVANFGVNPWISQKMSPSV